MIAQPRTAIPFNQSKAFAEGWGIINRRIVRLEYGPVIHGEFPGDPKFESDDHALGHVSRLAGDGSAYHKQALKETL